MTQGNDEPRVYYAPFTPVDPNCSCIDPFSVCPTHD